MKAEIPYRAAGTYVGDLYVERDADHVLMREIRANQRYPYVVAARQSGKSSLLVHTMRALDSIEFRTALVDLSPYQLDDYGTFWTRLLGEIARGTKLERTAISADYPEETFDAWLGTMPGRIVVFIDEIDALIEARFRDVFFAKIRWFFNARSTNKEYERIQFVLAGAAAPERLIQDSARSPFNVGIEVKLEDFSLEQVHGLAWGLKNTGAQIADREVSEEIHRLTSGSVFLCQFVLERLYRMAGERLCLTAVDVREAADAVVAHAPDEMHFRNIFRLIANNQRLLKDFVRLARGEDVGERSRQDLRLFGISKVTSPFRNPIYERVFGAGGLLDLFALAGERILPVVKAAEEEQAVSNRSGAAWLPWGVEPAYRDEETRELAHRLWAAYDRKQALEEQSLSTEGVDREIFEMHGRLREGAQVRPGDTLLGARYVVIGKLGGGASGSVHQAWDRVAQTMVALHFWSAPDHIIRNIVDFGVRIWAGIEHPDIVRLLNPDCKDGVFRFYVMEYMERGTLQQAIENASKHGNKLPAHQAFEVAFRVGNALAELHRQGAIHGDVNPYNILLDANGRVKLGNLRASSSSKDVRLKATIEPFGTSSFDPNEQFKTRVPTPSADVYALAATLVEALSGPMGPTSNYVVYGREHWHRLIEKLDQAESIKEVLRKATAFDPTKRYPDAAAFGEAWQMAVNVPEEIKAKKVKFGDFLSTFSANIPAQASNKETETSSAPLQAYSLDKSTTTSLLYRSTMERTSPVAAVHVRDHLVDVLRRDLVGAAEPHEVLSAAPSRWYLTGFLVPREAPIEVRQDSDPDESLASGGDDDGDDAAPPEIASARKAFFPSSIGVSVLVPETTNALSVRATWGEYVREGSMRPPPADETDTTQTKARPEEHWKRAPKQAGKTYEIPATGKKEYELAEGVRLVFTVRRVPEGSGVKEKGARAVSIFLVNDKELVQGTPKDQFFLFQAALEVHTEERFLPRPNIRGQDGDDTDEQIAELQYRDVFEYVVGHGIAAEADVVEGRACTRVRTTWLPTAEVEKVVPGKVDGVTIEMEALADAESAADVRRMLERLPAAYESWIDQQAQTKVETHQQDVLVDLLNAARNVQRRIVDGLAALDDADIFLAFRLANKAMARQSRARDTKKQYGAPTWRPFQLAFLLINLRAMHEPLHHDRKVIDLLFFPTGGGKTEAYLGLAAYTLVMRRLRNGGISGAGVSVIMRYTLRLLTLDQLGRAAALVCALELERQEWIKKGDKRLGTWPFEIGLWVGKGATPNRMGDDKNFDPSTARMKVNAFQENSDKNPAPIPIETCPWCSKKFVPNSFRLAPNRSKPSNLEVWCANRDCVFARETALPILAVDEPIYQRLPCFLIATVDKFAQLPWVGRSGALFGRVDRHDKAGFYGPCDPGVGSPIEGGRLSPPDLVIQDELHLISGPLGTMVGLYETAIDVLCERTENGKTFGPKIIASTATVRRAEAQIKALFGRSTITIFPPPGPDRRDSFFAQTVCPSPPGPLSTGALLHNAGEEGEKEYANARRYVGVAAPGRSFKVALLRVYLSMLAAGKKAYDEFGTAADPYTTLVGYFNSLRELGGSRRIVEDEVTSRIRGYDTRLRVGQTTGDFAKRSLGEVVELTSREATHMVARAKDRLACTMDKAEHVDVALATNMISVGLDISRLGLMVVLGQPKTTAEYIQATSRVGRDEERPGLVITLLNCHKPRDRSHYERFNAYHGSFYRAVEATSVTPFSPRAIDRGIAAVTVAMARLSITELTPPRGAEEIGNSALRDRVAAIPKQLGARAARAHMDDHEAPEIGQKVESRVQGLLDSWKRTVEKNHAVNTTLQYQREEPAHPQLLRDPLEPVSDDPDLRKFKAQRSLRDVEPSVDVFLRKPGARREEEG